MILLEVQGTRVRAQGTEDERRTCALTDFEVANFETSPMRLMLGQFVSIWGLCVCPL